MTDSLQQLLRGLGYFLAVVGSIYILICAVLFFVQDRLLFFPTQGTYATPEAVGLQFEDVHLQSESGNMIHGWFVPRSDADYTVIFFHGNAGNISHRVETIQLLHSIGCRVFIFDYSGYGESSGSPSEAALHADAISIWTHVTAGRGFAPGSIILFGRSLGTGVASELATQVEPAGMILEAPFLSVPDLASEIYPWLPTRWLARNKFDNRMNLAKTNMPLLLLHSRDDQLIPVRHSREIKDSIRPDATLVEMRGGHNDAFMVSRQIYTDALLDFIESL